MQLGSDTGTVTVRAISVILLLLELGIVAPKHDTEILFDGEAISKGKLTLANRLLVRTRQLG
jgi:hypothetical protein